MNTPPLALDPALTALCDSYVAAQLEGDRRAAVQLIQTRGLEQGWDALALQQVICEAQRRIGELWQDDRITIAQEHVATAISQLAMSHIYQLAPPTESNGHHIVVTCVEGELHDLPARLIADALDLSGFRVRFLGAAVPTTSLIKTLETMASVDMLALSVTMTFNVPALKDAVARVRERFGKQIPIAVGGWACGWSKSLAAEVEAEITGPDAKTFIEHASQYLREHP